MNNNNNNKSGNVTISKRNLIIIITAVVLLLLIIISTVVLASNWNNWFGEEPTDTTPTDTTDGSGSGWNPDIDDDAGDYTNPIPDAGGALGGIKIPGYPTIIPIKAGSAIAPIALVNPEGNPCYFCFEIVIKETGESLYQSKMVPPGQAISGVTLSKTLEKGSYPALIKITTFSVDDGSPMNTADQAVRIDVE